MGDHTLITDLKKVLMKKHLEKIKGRDATPLDLAEAETYARTLIPDIIEVFKNYIDRQE